MVSFEFPISPRNQYTSPSCCSTIFSFSRVEKASESRSEIPPNTTRKGSASSRACVTKHTSRRRKRKGQQKSKAGTREEREDELRRKRGERGRRGRGQHAELAPSFHRSGSIREGAVGGNGLFIHITTAQFLLVAIDKRRCRRQRLTESGKPFRRPPTRSHSTDFAATSQDCSLFPLAGRIDAGSLRLKVVGIVIHLRRCPILFDLAYSKHL